MTSPPRITFATDGSPQLHVSVDSLTITRSRSAPPHHALIRTSHPLPSLPTSSSPSSLPSLLLPLYFEATLNPPTSPPSSTPPTSTRSPHIRVGLAPPHPFPCDVPLGWGGSLGYIGKTGEVGRGGKMRGYGVGWGVGDVVGVRVTAVRVGGMECSASVAWEVAYAVNGVWQGVAFAAVDGVSSVWHPAVSLYGSASVSCRFEPPFAFGPWGKGVGGGGGVGAGGSLIRPPLLVLPAVKRVMEVGCISERGRDVQEDRVTWAYAVTSKEVGEGHKRRGHARQPHHHHHHHKRSHAQLTTAGEHTLQVHAHELCMRCTPAHVRHTLRVFMRRGGTVGSF